MDQGALLGRVELARRIRAGSRLFIAGDEALLRGLPAGEWVGGTTSYFIAPEGGLRSREKAYAVELPSFALDAAIKAYDARTLVDVYLDTPQNGYTLFVVPAFSRAAVEFSLRGRSFQAYGRRPLVGWVAGVELSQMGSRPPKVFDGRRREEIADGALAFHVSLPPTKSARAGAVNPFDPSDGDELTFAEEGFAVRDVLVNGRRRRFAAYLKELGLDTHLPLVAEYGGARVNTSFAGVDEASGEVRFYSPVFRGVAYRHARPVRDYVEALTSRLPRDLGKGAVFSCSCILNYLYAGLEGRRAGGVYGPATFGEVAYQLFNQTLVYLKVEDAGA